MTVKTKRSGNNSSSGLERLLASRRQWLAEQNANGRQAGAEWAKLHPEYEHLKKASGVEIGEHARLDALMNARDVARFIDIKEEQLFGEFRINSSAFYTGFVQGMQEVFEDVETEARSC